VNKISPTVQAWRSGHVKLQNLLLRTRAEISPRNLVLIFQYSRMFLLTSKLQVAFICHCVK